MTSSMIRHHSSKTSSLEAPQVTRALGRPRWLERTTKIIGGFMLVMAGLNLGLTFGNPDGYRTFADPASLAWVREAWSSVFMAAPHVWGSALALGEILLGVALLVGGRWALLGYLGLMVFHVALMLFGFWAWLWCIPVLTVLVPCFLAYHRHLRPAVAP